MLGHVTAFLVPAFLFTGIDVKFTAAVGVFLLVAAVAARLLIRATTPAAIELAQVERQAAEEATLPHVADEPTLPHVADEPTLPHVADEPARSVAAG